MTIGNGGAVGMQALMKASWHYGHDALAMACDEAERLARRAA